MMRMAIPEPATEGLVPTFTDTLDHGVTPEIQSLIEMVQASCRLPPPSSWDVEGGWNAFSGFDVGGESERTRGYAKPITDKAGALEVLRALDITPGADERQWWFRDNGFAGLIKGFVGGDENFMVVAAKSKARGIEGAMIGKRSVDMEYRPGEGMILTYNIDAKMVYVVPQARGKGMGRVLAAAFGRMVTADLEGLQQTLPQGEDVIVETRLCGEAQSDGGFALLGKIADQMDMAADMTVGPGVHAERDYSM